MCALTQTNTARDVRVVIADDSSFMRAFLRNLLERHPRVLVIGEAQNGLQAVDAVSSLNPDVLVLDIEMPVMDGLDALRRIMQETPLPVVMFSSRTKVGAGATLEALSFGAVDFVPKPDSRAGLELVGSELCCKVVAASAVQVRSRPARGQVRAGRFRGGITREANAKVIAVIGASTGGPSALESVIPALPSAMSGGVLICQHMPSGFTASMAERLDGLSKVPVREAKDGDTLRCGEVLVAPGGYHARLEAGPRVRLEESAPVHGVRPSVDVTLADAAPLFGPNLIAAILTGMGFDGAKGTREARKHGASVVCQDEATSIVWGMPRACVEIGAASEVLPLERIPGAICAFFDKVEKPEPGPQITTEGGSFRCL